MRLLRCRGGDPDSPISGGLSSCAKSFSIPKPPASTRCAAIGWSKSAVSRFSTACRPARPFTGIINPRARHAGRSLRRARPFQRIPRRQAAVRRSGRGVPGIHRRRAAGDPQRLVRYRLHQRRARPHQAAGRLRATGWSTRCCWRGASIRACRTVSTISARAMRSTIPAAPSTARLLDAELLAEVYIDLIGARQSQLILAAETRDTRAGGSR